MFNEVLRIQNIYNGYKHVIPQGQKQEVKATHFTSPIQISVTGGFGCREERNVAKRYMRMSPLECVFRYSMTRSSLTAPARRAWQSRQRTLLVFGTSLVQISSWTPAILFVVFSDFPQFFQANVGITILSQTTTSFFHIISDSSLINRPVTRNWVT